MLTTPPLLAAICLTLMLAQGAMSQTLLVQPSAPALQATGSTGSDVSMAGIGLQAVDTAALQAQSVPSAITQQQPAGALALPEDVAQQTLPTQQVASQGLLPQQQAGMAGIALGAATPVGPPQATASLTSQLAASDLAVNVTVKQDAATMMQLAPYVAAIVSNLTLGQSQDTAIAGVSPVTSDTAAALAGLSGSGSVVTLVMRNPSSAMQAAQMAQLMNQDIVRVIQQRAVPYGIDITNLKVISPNQWNAALPQIAPASQTALAATTIPQAAGTDASATLAADSPAAADIPMAPPTPADQPAGAAGLISAAQSLAAAAAAALLLAWA